VLAKPGDSSGQINTWYASISRRARILEIPELTNINNDEHLNIISDSTGLKIFGVGL